MPKARNGEYLAEPTEMMKMRGEAGRKRMQYKEHDQQGDLLLINRYQEGDEDAMLELIHRYSDVIYFAYNNPAKRPGQKIAKNLSFSFTIEDREDLFSCAIANFVDLVSTYDAEYGPFEHYVRGTLRYRVFNEFFEVEMDKQINESEHELDENLSDKFRSIFIEEKNEVTEEDLILYRALNTLTTRQRQIFEMMVVNQWTGQEVADELGIARTTAVNTKGVVVKKLREYYQKNGLI